MASLKRYNAGSSPEGKKRCRAADRVPVQPQPLSLAMSKKVEKDKPRTVHVATNKPKPFVPVAVERPPLEKTFIGRTVGETTAAINSFFPIPSAPQQFKTVQSPVKQQFVSKAKGISPVKALPVPSAPPKPAPQRPYLIPKAAPVRGSAPKPVPPTPISSSSMPKPFVPPPSSSAPRPFTPKTTVKTEKENPPIPPQTSDAPPQINIDEWLDAFPEAEEEYEDPMAQLYLETTGQTVGIPEAPEKGHATPPTAPRQAPLTVAKPVPFTRPGTTPSPAQSPVPTTAPTTPAPLTDPAAKPLQRAAPPSAPPPRSMRPVPFVPPPASGPVLWRPSSAPAPTSKASAPVPIPAPAPVSASTAIPAPAAPSTYGPLQDFPASVQEAYRRRGIKDMYDWQKEVLTLSSVKAGGNLVFSLPTSGGKSLVAEVLLLRSVLSGKSGVLVMPYVALVDEKVDALEPFAKLLDFEVVTSAGSTSQVPLAGTRFICICTIEKANALLNTMLTEKRADTIGCVVVDELHMVGEDGRGHTLELFLTKALATMPKCQLVGMSATVPNLPSLAKWLGAELYESDFRPVSLKQYLLVKNKDGTTQHDPEGAVVRKLETKQDDPTIALLVNEVIPKCCCLVFCTSKVGCEKTCRWLAARVNPEAQQHKTLQRQMLVREMKSVVAGNLDESLEASILAGVTYHHAGLTSEERKLIEAAFRDKVINIICCTSTLAAGVNLPARRVVIKYPFTGPVFLTKSRYLQMCGRAGRAGMDNFGESFLVTADRDLRKSRALMRSPIEQLTSKSGTPDAIERTLLDIVATETATTKPAIKAFMYKMLIGIEDTDDKHWAQCEKKLDELMKCRIVMPKADSQGCEGPELECTSFGSSAYKSGFTSREAQRLKKELREMQETGLILAHDLHMLYYLTPIRDIWGWRVCWNTYASVFARAPPLCRRIASMTGLSESFILQKSVQADYCVRTEDHDEYVARRFWLALMLSELLSEVPLAKVAKKYSADRGQLQSLQMNSSLFCSMMVGFTESMGWTSLQVTIQSYVKRLDCGVKADCAHLAEIRGVQAGRARCLWNAGYRDIQKIAQADPETIHNRVKQTGTKAGRENMAAKFFSLSAAVTIVEGAKRLVREQLAQKRKELQLLEQSSLIPP